MRETARVTGSASWPLLACLVVAACGGKPKPVTINGTTVTTETVALGNGYGLNLPKTLDGFARIDTEDRPHGTDILASYARTVDPVPMVATVRVRKAGEPGSLAVIEGTVTASTAGHSQTALNDAIAQVRHSYPDATILGTGPAFLVRFGAMQNGRAATLSYTDELNGIRQPIDLRIETFCCADGRWNYEFRFRYPASVAGAADPIAKFLSDVAWSPEPSGSIDKPD